MRILVPWLAGLLTAVCLIPGPSRSPGLATFAPPVAPVARPGFLAGRPDRTGLAPWVLEEITSRNLAGPGDRRLSSWHECDDALLERRARDLDYHLSGYSRGHARSAANAMNSQAAMNATHDLINIFPQPQKFNRGSWEQLEEYARRLADQGATVRIATIPLWKPQTHTFRRDGSERWTLVVHCIGPDALWVPTHLAKSLLIETADGRRSIENFLAANSDLAADQDIENWRITTERLKALAGFDLWPGITDAQ